MAIDRGNETTTQLLTLLNVSATKAGKRKWILDDARPAEKLNKRRNVQFGDVSVNEQEDAGPEDGAKEDVEGDAVMENEESEVKEAAEDNEDMQGESSWSCNAAHQLYHLLRRHGPL